MENALPIPTKSRWQPLRSGLINLFKYDNEVFPFINGRLLLRGNNGAGKSRVLALQLPFLLDGEIVPSRVEPDGDPAKRMEWHLLMNNRFTHRIGYTWIEFGRMDSDGRTEFCTLGCGMEMNKGGKFQRWLFVTPLRVGDSLKLIREGGFPLTRDGLEAALTAGAVYSTVRDYRKAVDDHLFHLKEERYEALVNLLIQLRKPQLSRELDEKVLSKALSDSLPPLDPATLNDCSEAFRELEEDKKELENFERSSAALQQFNTSYQRYAQVAVGRNAASLRKAHNDHEREQRAWRRCEEDLGKSKDKWDAAVTSEAESKRKKEETDGEVSALRDSPELKTAGDLNRRKSEADREAANAQQASKDFETANAAIADRKKLVDQASSVLDRDEKKLSTDIQALRKAESPLQLITALEDAESHASKLEVAKRRANNDLRQLREQHTHLSKLADDVTRAQTLLKSVEQKRVLQETRLNKARENEADHQARHKIATEELILATRKWFGESVQIQIPQQEELIEELLRWCETMSGRHAIRLAVEQEHSRIENEIGKLAGELKVKREVIVSKKAGLLLEQKGLREGVERYPEPSLTTDPITRCDRKGAPLWRVCDFQDSLCAEDRAGCEAALQAAGLLDAWITPDAKLAGLNNDIFIDCMNSTAPSGKTLAHLLKVVTNPQDQQANSLDVSVIEAVLNAISVERNGSVWVTTKGDWHNGILAGRWLKPEAAYIGAGAREAARQKRLNEIEGQLGLLDSDLQKLIQDESRLNQRRNETNKEKETLPDESPVREALTKWSVAIATVEKERVDFIKVSDEVSAQQKVCEVASAILNSNAKELKLEAWAQKLPELKATIDSVEKYQNEVWHSLETAHRSRQSLERLQKEVESGQKQVSELKERCVRAENLAARLQKEYETLEQVAGPKARAAAERFQIAEARLKELSDDLESKSKASHEAELNHVKLQAKLEAQSEKVQSSEEERNKHIEAFRTFSTTGMLEQLGELPEGIDTWSATRLIDYVREVHARIGAEALSDDAWDRTQNKLHDDFEELKKGLSAHNLRPESISQHGVDVISVEYDGKLQRVPEVLTRINNEVAHRRELLNAEERKFIENHLIGEIADHLHKLICRAAELVSSMSEEVRNRPTFAAGMMLRFKWEPREDGAPDTKSICDLLKRAKATWSEPERTKLASFLQDRIQEIRNSPDFGTWRECLELAVDYREWHIFYVEQKMDGDWRRLTKRTHGTGSSGEKAVALTIPQFAAAAAHYHSAPQAPRLILLDEVFVGIDPHMRANCMGLLESFDLDFVMTSENEWGCYPTISGLSICQLSTRAGFNAVAVTPWIWNGKVRSRAHEGESPKGKENAVTSQLDNLGTSE